jgi:UDP-3-O-[3-hydroxymyristoyl] glucosamine N-acyltransferase
MKLSLAEITDIVGGRLIGNPDIKISGVASLEDAGSNDISFFAKDKYKSLLYKSKAAAFIVGSRIPLKDKNLIIVDNPYYAFALLLRTYYQTPYRAKGISDKAIIGKDCSIGRDVTLYPYVYIGDNCIIGDRVTLYPGVVICDNVKIGEDTVLYPNVSIYQNIKIGKRVIIHSGTVVGSDGFGFVLKDEKQHKIPQIGTVVIEDDVELGSNVCVDRATLGKTILKRGVKVDNLVQIGHNVSIGEDSIIVSQVGLSGSSKIGRRALLAGRAATVHDINIGNHVTVSGQAVVTKDLPDGSFVSGFPAIDHKIWKKSIILFKQLPQLFSKMKKLEEKLNRLIDNLNK